MTIFNLAPTAPLSGSFVNVNLLALTSSAENVNLSAGAPAQNFSFVADQAFYIAFGATSPVNVPASGALSALTGVMAGPFAASTLHTFRLDSGSSYFKVVAAANGHLSYYNSSAPWLL